MMQHPRVLVLDSGIGGLSIARALRDHCPPSQWIYLADLAAFPYGGYSEAYLSQHIINLMDRVLAEHQLDLVVIACNTASTAVLEPLRARYPLPFVGVVPAIKPAAQRSQSGVIGVLATAGTVNRTYTRELINQFASHCQVHLYGVGDLVVLAEQKLQGRPIDTSVVRRALDEFILQDAVKAMDTIVLACTHFPLLETELRTVYPHILHWIDSSEAIARRVTYWLNHLGFNELPSLPVPNNFFISTGHAPHPYATKCIRALLGPFEYHYLHSEKTKP